MEIQTKKIEKAIFEIEAINGFEQYEGVSLGYLWNGWECPYFKIEEVKKIIANMDSEQDAIIYDFTHYSYDNLYDVIIEKTFYDGKIETIHTSKPIIIQGEKYYSIGSFNWTWTKQIINN